MQSRMDKYNTDYTKVKSRIEKNRDLYENVKNSSLRDFDVNSNIQVIDDNQEVIDVSRVRDILDRKYRDDTPKRKSIIIPEEDDYPTVTDEIEMDTKEYDINAILSKAKEGKSVDYSKERLKFVRDSQRKILEDLDLELKKIEEPEHKTKNVEAEENLMNLINTITRIEEINKVKYSKEVSGAMDLLGLGDDEDSTVVNELRKEVNEEKEDNTTQVELEPVNETKETHIEETLSKLNIDFSSYDDFKDISKSDKASIIIKIVLFIVILALLFGALFILNNILDLGIF